jgi:hypothetical protein
LPISSIANRQSPIASGLTLIEVLGVLLGALYATIYLHALVWAEQGSLAAIPAGRRGMEAVLRGAFVENEVWPEACWAAAFESLEWLYDPTYLDTARRPPHLAVGFEWQEAVSRRLLSAQER